MNGEVIGINTAIIPNGQGIGFSIPVNTARELIPQLIHDGKVTRGFIGVSIQNISSDLSSSLKLGNTKGALVGDVVKGGPADKAGVKRGDVIVGFGAKEIKESRDLPSVVAATPVGKEVPLHVIRDGKTLTLTLKVSRLESGEKGEEQEQKTSQSKWGLGLEDLTASTARRMGLKGDHGVVVVGVQPGSPAEEASVKQGDIILEVNRQGVNTVDDVKQMAEKSKDRDSILLLVERNGTTMYIVLKS
jgi:serine protease Do